MKHRAFSYYVEQIDGTTPIIVIDEKQAERLLTRLQRDLESDE